MEEKKEERGFNDKELKDIMDEIESLEKELAEESSAPKKPASGYVGNDSQLEIDEVVEKLQEEEMKVEESSKVEELSKIDDDSALIDNLSEMTVASKNIEESVSEKVEDIIEDTIQERVEDKIIADDEKVFKFERPAKSVTKMDFSIEGSMTLNLNLSVSGQTISFYINEDDFVVEMGNGARFMLPIDLPTRKVS